jgi:hypothetical protein
MGRLVGKPMLAWSGAAVLAALVLAAIVLRARARDNLYDDDVAFARGLGPSALSVPAGAPGSGPRGSGPRGPTLPLGSPAASWTSRRSPRA